MGHISDTAKHWIDLFSLGALIGTLLDIIPVVTAFLVLIWTVMRLYESILNIRLQRMEIAKRRRERDE